MQLVTSKSNQITYSVERPVVYSEHDFILALICSQKCAYTVHLFILPERLTLTASHSYSRSLLMAEPPQTIHLLISPNSDGRGWVIVYVCVFVCV